MTITPEGGRVLGCLVEKELTTPQQYPLTANALAQACSQTTNRDPVMSLDDGAVHQALDELKGLRLVRFVLPSHGRSVTRYRHVLGEVYGLDALHLALLGALLLRGPQTLGQLRARTARMAELDSLGTVQQELEALGRRPEPLAHLLSRQPGQKEDRWQQLLAMESTGAGMAGGGPERASQAGPGDVPPRWSTDRTGQDGPMESAPTGVDPTDLEHRVRLLTSEVAELRDQVIELRSSIDDLRLSLGE